MEMKREIRNTDEDREIQIEDTDKERERVEREREIQDRDIQDRDKDLVSLLNRYTIYLVIDRLLIYFYLSF